MWSGVKLTAAAAPQNPTCFARALDIVNRSSGIKLELFVAPHLETQQTIAAVNSIEDAEPKEARGQLELRAR
jgi:hypothetical protein